MAVFTTALSVSHLITTRNWKQWLKWWMPTVALCLVPFCYYVSLPGATDLSSIIVSRIGLPIFMNAAFVIYGILVGTTYGPPQWQLRGDDKISVLLGAWPGLLLLFLVAIAILFFLIRTSLKEHSDSKFQQTNFFFTCLLITSFIFGLLLAIVTKMNWVARHSFYLWLPLSMLIPSAFCWPSWKRRQNTRYADFAKFSVIALIILNLYSTCNYYFNSNYWRDDYRSVAQYLIRHQTPSSNSILLFGSQRLLKYYGDLKTVDGSDLKRQWDAGDSNWSKKIPDMTDDAEQVIVVVNREQALDRLGSVEAELAKVYKVESIVDSFIDFKLYHLKANGSGSETG